MDDLHSLSLHLLNLLRQYEDGIEKEMSFTEVNELREKIHEAQTRLEQRREMSKAE